MGLKQLERFEDLKLQGQSPKRTLKANSCKTGYKIYVTAIPEFKVPVPNRHRDQNLRKGSRCERRQPATFLATRQILYRMAWNLEWNFKGTDLVSFCQVVLVSLCFFHVQDSSRWVRSFLDLGDIHDLKISPPWIPSQLQGMGRLERFLWRIRLQGDLDASRLDSGWRCKVIMTIQHTTDLARMKSLPKHGKQQLFKNHRNQGQPMS